ncbi:triose-phosphate isomerase [Flavobacteriales bacterium]|nr:triose-phosphate isomerase [Flavobacteriales bacterium]
MREKIVAGNWKMNKNRDQGLALVSEIESGLKSNPANEVRVIVAPPYPFLGLLDFTEKVKLSAQNCYQEESGAYTGEIATSMLKSFRCDYCIVGHSERRQYFGETDRYVNHKIELLLKNGVKPIYCCGELLEERQEGRHFEVVEEQIQSALQGFKREELLQVVVAYEPVWAIGTGETATPEQAQEMHVFIRKKLAQVMGDDAQKVSIIYGGSVKPTNAKEIFSQKDIDGGLIGGASLVASDFLQLVHSF